MSILHPVLRSYATVLFALLYYLGATVVASSSSHAADSLQLAQAGSGSWVVESAAGDVSITPAGGTPRAAQAGESVPANATVTTGSNGQAQIGRGSDRATLSSGSSLTISDSGAGSLFTRLVQRLGTILFQVEKTPETDFEVQTPYLAATVKGTTFTVTVRTEGAAVHVTDGAVQVATRDNAQRVLLRPGQSGSVSSEPGAGIEVSQQQGRAQPQPATDGETAESETAEAASPTAAPAEQAAADAQPAASTERTPGNGKALGRAIGTDTADFSVLTDGFAGNATAQSARRNGRGNGNRNGNESGNIVFVETSTSVAPGNSANAGNGRGNSARGTVGNVNVNGQRNGNANGRGNSRVATIGDAVSIGRPTGIDVATVRANSNAGGNGNGIGNGNAGGNGNGNGNAGGNGNSGGGNSFGGSSNNAGGNGNGNGNGNSGNSGNSNAINNVFVANGSGNSGNSGGGNSGNGNSGNGNGNSGNGNGNSGNGNGNSGNGNGNSGNGNGNSGNGNSGNGNGNGKNK